MHKSYKVLSIVCLFLVVVSVSSYIGYENNEQLAVYKTNTKIDTETGGVIHGQEDGVDVGGLTVFEADEKIMEKILE